MNNSNRPHADNSIGELESLFEESRGDLHALGLLKAELDRRKTQRARLLLQNIEAAMRQGGATPIGASFQRPLYSRSDGANTDARRTDDVTSEPPSCPLCGASMMLRTARKGQNAGGKFWGCTQFPDCRGTRDLGDTPASAGSPAVERGSEPTTSIEPYSLASLPISWIEGAPRTDFVPEYVSVGALPGTLQSS